MLRCSDEDIVIGEIGTDIEDEDDDGTLVASELVEEEEILPLVVRTRYRIHAGSWNLFQLT